MNARVVVELPDDHPGIHVDSVLSAIEIASSSNHVALLQRRFVASVVESGRLAIALDAEMAIEQAIYLVNATSRLEPKPEAILFREWLQRKV